MKGFRLTSGVLAVVFVVFPLVFERQLVAQRRGQGQQAGGAGSRGQRGLKTCWMGGERDWNGMTVGEVLSLELLLLKDIQKQQLINMDKKNMLNISNN